ncbi:MAG: hypothetical protein CMJ72_05675 [Planctomycetaceae bacterium]|nr:hypothetical protein [Planctomycetaceae bacterium]HCK40050.1 hypothetical protein [Planctomycetaceae bacterium]
MGTLDGYQDFAADSDGLLQAGKCLLIRFRASDSNDRIAMGCCEDQGVGQPRSLLAFATNGRVLASQNTSRCWI